MAERVVESLRWKSHFEDVVPPKFCPLCGRALEDWRWTSGSTIYPSLVCYGGRSRTVLKLFQIWAMGESEPAGAHYEMEMPSHEQKAPKVFDPYTGQQQEASDDRTE